MIQDDIYVELLEVLELYSETLQARFGLLDQDKLVSSTVKLTRAAERPPIPVSAMPFAPSSMRPQEPS